MKIKVPHIATVFFFLTVAVMLLSWVGSIYEWEGVRSLLSPEGVRWGLRHTVDNYLLAPVLRIVIILYLGCGLVAYSGLGSSLLHLFSRRSTFTKKEKHALSLALVIALCLILLLLVITWGPWAILRNVSGELSGSPFEAGLWYMLSIGIGVCALFYGFAADTINTDRDVVKGMSWLFTRYGSYYVTLFFIVTFFSSLEYSRLFLWMGGTADDFRLAYTVCCLLPFGGYLLSAFCKSAD